MELILLLALVSPVVVFCFVGGEGEDFFFFRIRGDELRLFAKFHRPVILVAPDASPATRNISLLLFTSNLNPYVALRDKFWRVTIGLLLFSRHYSYVALDGKYMIPPHGLSR